MTERSSQSASKPPGRHPRSDHRSRHHNSAHADGAAGEEQIIIDHSMVPRTPGELITDQAALGEFLLHLREHRSFAYDSEFIGELSYHPQLCLIQASTTERIGLIDPMADLDLRPFWELLCDPSIEKLVHAGEQDVEPVHRLTGTVAANVFDTQIVAGFVGLAYPVGLSKLVQELLGVRLGKGLTFTHWDQRPLSAMQLRYAADDVRYLPAIVNELRQRLQKVGHTVWAQEECASLCDPSRYGFDPQNTFLRIRGAGGLSSSGLAILRDLTIWRDVAAREDNLPARAFLKDEILLDMARSPIKSVQALERVKGLPRPVEAEYGQALVDLTRRAMETPPDQRPIITNIEPTPVERFGTESMYAVAASICTGQQLDPALVTSRQEITELHHALLQNDSEAVAALRLMRGWRGEACGKPLVQLHRGQGAVKLCWQDGRLQATF